MCRACVSASVPACAQVEYDVVGFLNKNKDELMPHLEELCAACRRGRCVRGAGAIWCRRVFRSLETPKRIERTRNSKSC